MGINKPEVKDSTSEEGLKAQLDVLLAEYSSTRNIIDSYRGTQNQLDNLAFGVLGLSIPLISYLIEKNLLESGVLMLLPLLFFAIAFNQIRQDRMIFNTARYNDQIIRTKTNAILSKLSSIPVSVLEMEQFFIKKGVNTLFLTWLSVLLAGIISIVIGSLILFSQFFLRPLSPILVWSGFEIGLFAISVCALMVDLGLAFHIASQRFDYYRQYLKKRDK